MLSNSGIRMKYLFSSILPKNVNNHFNLLTIITIKSFSIA